ncbi:MAG: ribosome recycling factor [Burkholderiaceae bacterium]
MSTAEVMSTARQKMEKSVDALRNNLSKVRTGRPSPALLDHVQVDYYGSMVPISQVANVTLVDGRTLGVQPWEKKMVAIVDKAIRESDLGLNPTVLGDLLRIPMPPLSEERRRELTKVVRSEGEQAKVAIRNLRRDANDQLKRLVKDKEISEDEERRTQDSVQKLTDQFVADVDELLADKEKDIMTV